MPTASGALTAGEKRDRDNRRIFAAIREVATHVVTADWIAAQVATYKASGRHAFTGPNGEMLEHSLEFPKGPTHHVGRLDIDEGRARALAVADAVRAEGFNPHLVTSFGLGYGSSLVYAVSEFRAAPVK